VTEEKTAVQSSYMSFTLNRAGQNAKVHTISLKAIVALAVLFVVSFTGCLASAVYWYSAQQERHELAEYRAQYGVYTERLEKLMAENEKMEKELAQVAALEAAVRKRLAKDGDGVSRGEIDRESMRQDMLGQGSGNTAADTLDVLEVQNEIITKRLAYKKENLYNMLNELSNVGDGSFMWPMEGGEISSFYGLRADPFGRGGGDYHPGLDIANAYGTPIKAACTGKVVQAGWNGGYGQYVRIDHGNGQETAYGHMSAIAVEAGQAVQRGEVIGYVGSTGASTGPHLHFEVLENGSTVNPLEFVHPGKK